MTNQTNQMPAAWMYDWETPEGEFIEGMTTDDFGSFAGDHVGRISNIRPLYFGALPSPWKDLTEQESVDIAVACGCMSVDWLDLVKAVQEALKAKNT